MAATLITMSAGTGTGTGQDEMFYTLLKPMLSEGFPAEESALFGFDTKNLLMERSGQSEYAHQVNAVCQCGDVLPGVGYSLSQNGRGWLACCKALRLFVLL